MDELRVVVLISSDMSDVYFANQMLKHLEVVGIFIEQQHEQKPLGRKIRKMVHYAVRPWCLIEKLRDDRIVRNHTKKTRQIDLQHFGHEAVTLNVPPGCELIHTEGKNAINEPRYVATMRSLRPDLIVVCGSSILRAEILALAPYGVLNLHGGLSQRYRGIWTTLWAVVNEEPEYVGATVHYVSQGIDDGDIIYQGRPTVDSDDNPESLYVKVVKLGVEMMIQAVIDMSAGTIKRYPLPEKGPLYLGKMVTPKVLETAWRKVDLGVINRYLAEKELRDVKVKQIMCGDFNS